MKQLELSLNWVCDAIENLLNSAQVHVHGRELVAIIGKGDERDNWEAAYAWLESLDVNENTDLDGIRRQFTGCIDRCLRLMRARKLLLSSSGAMLPYHLVSARERENLAHAISYLARRQIDQWNCSHKELTKNYPWFQLSIKGTDLVWEHAALVEHCLIDLNKANLKYRFFPGELLPLLANRLYRRRLAPILEGELR